MILSRYRETVLFALISANLLSGFTMPRAAIPNVWKSDHDRWDFKLNQTHLTKPQPIVIRELAENDEIDFSMAAVGDDGIIAYRNLRSISPDWKLLDSSIKVNLKAITIADFNWVIVGDKGHVITALVDFSRWTSTILNPDIQFEDVSNNGTQWVTVGGASNPDVKESKSQGWIAVNPNRTPNEDQWTLESFPGCHFYSIGTDGKKWMVSGHQLDDNGQKQPLVMESSDLTHWNTITIDPTILPADTTFRHIAHGSQGWVGIIEQMSPGQMHHTYFLISQDGSQWQESNQFPGFVSKPKFDGVEWNCLLNIEKEVPGSEKGTWLLQSFNGQNWHPLLTLPSAGFTGLGMVSTLGRRIIAGASDAGIILEQPIYNKSTLSPIEFDYRAFDIEESDDQWIAVGEQGKLSISTNGIDWSRHDAEPTMVATPSSSQARKNLHRVIKRNGIWLTAGDEGEIWKSQDGLRWNQSHSLTGLSFWDIEFAQNRWVVAGQNQSDGLLLTSSDLLTWASVKFPSNPIINVEYGNGNWLAQGLPNVGFHSTDGINWKKVTLDSGDAHRSLVFADSKWLKSSVYGSGSPWIASLLISQDALVWKTVLGTFFNGMQGGPIWHTSDRWWMHRLSRTESLPDGGLKESGDGIHWRWIDREPRISSPITDIIMRNDRVHLFTAQSALSGSMRTFLEVLTPNSQENPSKSPGPTIRDTSYGIARWMAIGDQHLETSNDGINWFPVLNPEDGSPSGLKLIARGDDEWGIIQQEKVPRPASFFHTFDSLHGGLQRRFRLPSTAVGLSEWVDLTFLKNLWWLTTKKKIFTVDGTYTVKEILDTTEAFLGDETLKALDVDHKASFVLASDGTLFTKSLHTPEDSWTQSTPAERQSDRINPEGRIYHDLICKDDQQHMIYTYPSENGYLLGLEQFSDNSNVTTLISETSTFQKDAQFKLGFNEGWWVVCGGGGFSKDATVNIYISRDSSNWQMVHTIKTRAVPESLRQGGGQWIILLTDGTRLRSGPDNWLQATFKTDTTIPQIQMLGKTDQTLVLDYSSDLANWHPLERINTKPIPTTVTLPLDHHPNSTFIRQHPDFTVPRSSASSADSQSPFNSTTR